MVWRSSHCRAARGRPWGVACRPCWQIAPRRSRAACCARGRRASQQRTLPLSRWVLMLPSDGCWLRPPHLSWGSLCSRLLCFSFLITLCTCCNTAYPATLQTHGVLDAAARLILGALCRSSLLRLRADAFGPVLDDLPLTRSAQVGSGAAALRVACSCCVVRAGSLQPPADTPAAAFHSDAATMPPPPPAGLLPAHGPFQRGQLWQPHRHTERRAGAAVCRPTGVQGCVSGGRTQALCEGRPGQAHVCTVWHDSSREPPCTSARTLSS